MSKVPPMDRTPIDDYIERVTPYNVSDDKLMGDLDTYHASRSLDDMRSEGITKDVAFNRASFDGGAIKSPTDNGFVQIGTDGIEVTLVQDFRDDELQEFFSWAINATRGIDPRNPPDTVDWEEMMRGGLQTALKRINIAFGVFGASRTATHQIVRSTRANFHQQSQRAHFYGAFPEARCPESTWANERARGAWLNALVASHIAYQVAVEENISYQDARFGLLEATDNFIMCEYSLDEFINVYAYRGCSMFQWEIVYIVREMRRLLVEAHPWLDPYIKISCEKTAGAKDSFSAPKDDAEAVAHTCTFQGWEEVDGQCDFPWARETNRAFRSERHAIVNKNKEVKLCARSDLVNRKACWLIRREVTPETNT